MAQIKVTINNNRSLADELMELQPYCGDTRKVLQRMSRLMDNMAEGSEGQSMTIQVNGGQSAVQASGTLTLSSTVATNTAQVGNQTFTAEASPSGPNQFAVGLSDSATAANLAAAINANPAFALASGGGLVSASAAGAVVTVTSSAYGTAGNMIQLVGSTHIVASGSGYLTGGVEPTANNMVLWGLK